MKKSIIAFFAAATMAAGVSAQDKAGEDGAFGLGTIGGEEIATGAVVVGITAAIIANNRGTSGGGDVPPIQCGDDEELVDGVCTPISTVTNTDTTPPVTVTSTDPGGSLTCNDNDVLVDDVCVGTTNTTTNTLTVSASQTVTQTITVPVTFTYAPTVN